ncbi:MAG: DUF819 family protein [Planctomycetes bacterium]|nr:DUF819 family protein [Planctomycetota bacterium]
MTPVIRPDNTWALWAVIVTGTAAAIWLEQTYKWAAKISGPVLALVMAMILSNVGVMPASAPSYSFVDDYLVPLAIPLLLMRANLWKIARETGWMFVAFHISALGTILGGLLATWLLRARIENIASVAGIMTASYTGGGVNFFAVKASFDVREDLTNPLLVADNFIMAGMFVALLFIAGSTWFLRHYHHPHTLAADGEQAKNLAAEHWRRKEISLLDLAKSVGIAFAVVAVAQALSALVEQFSASTMLSAVLGNRFVLITFLSTLVATFAHRWVATINGPEELGSYLLYVFLFAIGLPADLGAVIWNVPLLFLFCLIIAITNLVVTLGLGKLLKIDLEELLLSVNATLGGPPTAAAMAIAKGWSALILPALLVGIWGYVIGTFLGVFVGEFLQRMIGA